MLAIALFLFATPQVRHDDSATYRIGADRWTLGIGDSEILGETLAYVKKNGKTVLVRTAEDMSAYYFRVVRAWYPTPWPVFVVAAHTGMGHGLRTEFYAVDKGELRLLLRSNISNGGPIFRDFDGDGVMEWVFDNYYRYEHFDEGPPNYLVYRLDDVGNLDLWKTLPNRGRKHLSMPWYRCF